MNAFRIILILLLLQGGALAAQNLFTGLFKQGTEEYRYVFQNNWQDFMARQAEMDSQGYSPVDIESGTEKGYRLFWGIWKKDGVRSVVKRLESWEELVMMKRVMADSFVMADIEAYLDGDKEYYLAVWVPGATEHKVRKLSSWEGLSNDYEDLTLQGLQIVDLEGFEAGDGTTHYLALYHKMPPDTRTMIYRSPDMDSFMVDKSYRNKSGYHLFDLEHFEKRGAAFITGLYRKESNIDMIIGPLPWDEFNQQMKEAIGDKGLVLVDIDIYPEDK
ncbi:MAG: hypothetical protein H6564_22480 [Lewinellaceae bacterium]|nr:hypothetical protein [Lewinellaceae bacterium]